MKILVFPLLLAISIVVSGCANSDSTYNMSDNNESPIATSSEIIEQVTSSGIIVDIYAPLTIRGLIESGQILVEFTLEDVLSTTIEGAPQGWSGNNHNKLLFRVDNVLCSSLCDRVPYIGEKITILSHHDTEYHVGQQYLAFIHFDIIVEQRGGVAYGMTPYSLDNRTVAIINEDRSITATASLGFYLQEYDGFTIEEMMESIQGYLLSESTPNDANAELMPDKDMLIFNEGEYVLAFSPVLPEGYRFIDLTDDEIHMVFSDLMHFANLSLRGSAFVRDDDSFGFLLSSLTVYDDSSDIAIGFGQWHGLTMSADGFNEPPAVSEVHGVPVTAFFADIGHSSGIFFQAMFQADDVPYMVIHWNPDATEGKERLTEVVNMLILHRPVLDVVFPGGGKIVTTESE